MSSLTLERPLTVAPATALQLAVAALERVGYERNAGSATDVQLLYRAGSPSSPQLHLHRHRLTVSADGAILRFVFEAGLSHSGLVVQSERAELDRRVDQVMAEIVPGAGPAAQPRDARCPVCATLITAGSKTCPMCGIQL